MCFWSRVWLLVNGLRSLSAGPCSFRTHVAPPGSFWWLIPTLARFSVFYLFLLSLGDVLDSSKHETRAGARVVNSIGILNATTDLGHATGCLRNIYNTIDEAATGNTTLSKIASKILGGIFFVIFLGNQGISKFLKVFGVAMEIFVSPQNRGFLTRLNTAFTPAFWTAAGAESTSDASVCTWALINARSAG
jgi:hypothetical protein